MTAARSTSERGGRGAGDGDGEGSARASQEQAGAAHLSLGVLESVATVGEPADTESWGTGIGAVTLLTPRQRRTTARQHD